MNRPLISVIVPVYKVEAFLPRCVDSLLRQTYPNLEIILVDDGSPDRCGEICDSYAEKDGRVKVIHKRNGGLSSARNAGIDIARGEYLGFVDSDDWVDADGYERLYSLAEKYQVSMVCAGRYDMEEETGAETVGLCPQKEEVVSGVETASRIFRWDNMDMAAWDKLYHRSLFREIRYPLGIIWEDLPVTYRLALKAERCAFGNFPFYHYFHRKGSITTNGFSEREFVFPENSAKIDRYIQENYPLIQDASGYLRIRSIGWTVQMLELTDSQTRARFAVELENYRALLRKNLPDAMRNPYFTGANKRDFILLSMGLYRPLRAVRNTVRGTVKKEH